MGGVINVAVRLPDGTATCTTRWTNPGPHWFNTPEMWRGDPEHVAQWLAATRNADYLLDKYAPGRPQPVRNNEYGLLVWDYMTGHVLDNNMYSDPRRFDPIWTGGKDRREGFVRCAQAGMLRLGTWTGARPMPWQLGPLLAPEQALQLGEQAHAAQRQSWRVGGKAAVVEHPELLHAQFFIHSDTMRYISYGDKSDVEYDEAAEEYPLHPDFLAKLQELNFPMTAEQGLNATLRPPPPPRELEESERLEREFFQQWKTSVPPPGPDYVDGRAYDGQRYEDVPQAVRAMVAGAVHGMSPEQLRAMRLHGLLG